MVVEAVMGPCWSSSAERVSLLLVEQNAEMPSARGPRLRDRPRHHRLRGHPAGAPGRAAGHDDLPRRRRLSRPTARSLAEPLAYLPGRRSVAGGSYARIGGSGFVQRSTSTRRAGPSSPGELRGAAVEGEDVRLPWTHIESGSAGSTGRTRRRSRAARRAAHGVAHHGAGQAAARSLNTRTTSPLRMPRATASAGWSDGSAPARAPWSTGEGPTSSWLSGAPSGWSRRVER